MMGLIEKNLGYDLSVIKARHNNAPCPTFCLSIIILELQKQDTKNIKTQKTQRTQQNHIEWFIRQQPTHESSSDNGEIPRGRKTFTVGTYNFSPLLIDNVFGPMFLVFNAEDTVVYLPTQRASD